MHESLEKIKEYTSYYDWYDHVSIYDLKFLIAQAEKVELLEKEMQFHKGYCIRFSDKIKELEEENQRLSTELMMCR